LQGGGPRTPVPSPVTSLPAGSNSDTAAVSNMTVYPIQADQKWANFSEKGPQTNFISQT